MDTAAAHQMHFLAALLITVLWAAFAALVVGRPLHATLRDPAAASPRAAFCRNYASLALVLVPLAALVLAIPEWWARESHVLAVVALVQWPLAVLAGVVLLLGPLVSLMVRGPETVVSVSREQAGDLARLLVKMDGLRAHQVVRRESEMVGDEGGEERDAER
jgi:hypothetical protein